MGTAHLSEGNLRFDQADDLAEANRYRTKNGVSRVKLSS